MSEPVEADDWPEKSAGTFNGYKPQWKHANIWGPANKKFLKLEGGDDWTDVQYTVHRGGLAIRLPDGSEVLVGVPFPRVLPGILETIGLCGKAQAMALAWNFAAHVQACGGDIEVRAEHHRVKYDIKSQVGTEKDSA